MRINLDNLYIKIIVIFPLFTLLQAHIEVINKLLFVFLVIIQAILLMLRKGNRGTYISIFVVLLLELIALSNTSFPLYNVNDIFYFPFLVVYYDYFVNNKNRYLKLINNNLSYIKAVIYIWNLLVFISLFLPSSYAIEWGGYKYFQSFSNTIFRLAPASLFVLTLVLDVMVIKKDKKFIVWSIVPFYCFFAGGSRVYFVVGLLVFSIAWYYCFYNRKQVLWLSLIPLIGGISMLFFQSAIWDKFVATWYTNESYFDFWGTVTNSRTIFWSADLKAFSQGDLFHKLLGYGFNFIYEVNYITTGARIWGHNDFIQVLTTYGSAGLVYYLISINNILKIMFSEVKRERVLVLMVVMIWFLNAFFNMFYTYFCSLLSFPFLVLAISLIESEKEFKKHASCSINGNV